MNAQQHKECAQLVLDRLLEVYGKLQEVTISINYHEVYKLIVITGDIDFAIKFVKSLRSKNAQDKQLCKLISGAIKTLVRLRKRIIKIVEKDYIPRNDTQERQQCGKLATSVLEQLQNINHDVVDIIRQTSSEKIKRVFEKVLSNVESAASHLNIFINSDPVDEDLQDDLYLEDIWLSYEIDFIRELLQKNNEEQKS